MKTHVMLDLETMGRSAGAAIVAIGATHFQIREDGRITREINGFGNLSDFYEVIPLQSSLNFGLRIDGDTVEWWLGQSDEARAELIKPHFSCSIGDALVGFKNWLPKNALLWSYGANFDVPVLEEAYRKMGCPVPWSYKNVRCLRTILKLADDLKPQGHVTKHHALDDCRAQMVALAGAQRILGCEIT